MQRDDYKTGCNAEMKILRSFGDTIRIEHSPNEYDKALDLSKVYCAEEKNYQTKTNLIVMDVVEQLIFARVI